MKVDFEFLGCTGSLEIYSVETSNFQGEVQAKVEILECPHFLFNLGAVKRILIWSRRFRGVNTKSSHT